MKRFRPIQSERGGILIKMIVLLFLMTFFLALYFVRHPIFRFMAESWVVEDPLDKADADRKSTRLNSSHITISYAVFCLKKKKNILFARWTTPAPNHHENRAQLQVL